MNFSVPGGHTLMLALTLVLCLFPLPALAGVEADEDPSVNIFLQACATTYLHESEVAAVATDLGLAEMPPAKAKKFLRGHDGRIWQGDIKARFYALMLWPEQNCTLSVHQGEPAKIQATVESWMPPASTGVGVKRENLADSPEEQTTVYDFRGGKVHERWIVSVYTDPKAVLRASMTWLRLPP